MAAADGKHFLGIPGAGSSQILPEGSDRVLKGSQPAPPGTWLEIQRFQGTAH